MYFSSLLPLELISSSLHDKDCFIKPSKLLKMENVHDMFAMIIMFNQNTRSGVLSIS
jgi:hypothetical protein